MWKQYWALLTISYKNDVKEEDWLKKACEFGNNFKHLYSAEDVTPYLHLFVYHFGYYLENLGNIEIFANYAIEGHHKSNKAISTSATNGYGIKGRTVDITKQQINYSTRQSFVNFKKISNSESTKSPRSKKNWVEKSLERFPDVNSVFASPKDVVN